MGWLYPYHTTTKKLLVEDVLAGWKRCEGIVHATKCVSDGMWILVTPKGYTAPIIGMYLMKKAQGLWGYKDMCESSGPYCYDVPLDWLDKAPVLNQNWRNGVLEHYKEKEVAKAARKSLQVGKTYNVGGAWKIHGYHVTQVYVSSIKPLRGGSGPHTFRIPRKMAAMMTEAP